jgi:hypothetical protein
MTNTLLGNFWNEFDALRLQVRKEQIAQHKIVALYPDMDEAQIIEAAHRQLHAAVTVLEGMSHRFPHIIDHAAIRENATILNRLSARTWHMKLGIAI